MQARLASAILVVALARPIVRLIRCRRPLEATNTCSILASTGARLALLPADLDRHQLAMWFSALELRNPAALVEQAQMFTL